MSTKRLIDDDLIELLDLVAKSKSVELKLTVPESGHRSAITALDLDPLDAQIRQVYFFDTPDLALFGGGVVVRARRVQGKGDDSVVKLRPVVPDRLPPEFQGSPNLGVEVDAMPGGYVCSASMKAKQTPSPVRPAVQGEAPIRKMFTKEQRKFYSTFAPDGIALDDLRVLGPIFVLKLPFARADYPRARVVAEMWLYPDGSRILELSTKCKPEETIATAIDARRFLEGRGIDLGSEQQTKTRTALRFFSKELTSAPVTAG